MLGKKFSFFKKKYMRVWQNEINHLDHDNFETLNLSLYHIFYK